MKRLAISLIVWAAAVTGLYFNTNAPRSQVTPQQRDEPNAGQELRAIHQQIVSETILY